METSANRARVIESELLEPNTTVFDYVTYQPYGVVAVIPPWNYPLHLPPGASARRLPRGTPLY